MEKGGERRQMYLEQLCEICASVPTICQRSTLGTDHPTYFDGFNEHVLSCLDTDWALFFF